MNGFANSIFVNWFGDRWSRIAINRTHEKTENGYDELFIHFLLLALMRLSYLEPFLCGLTEREKFEKLKLFSSFSSKYLFAFIYRRLTTSFKLKFFFIFSRKLENENKIRENA